MAAADEVRARFLAAYRGTLPPDETFDLLASGGGDPGRDGRDRPSRARGAADARADGDHGGPAPADRPSPPLPRSSRGSRRGCS